MEESYLISIAGNQIVNGKSDSIQFVTLGSYNTRGNKKFISYYEYDDVNPNIKIKTTINIENDNILILTKKSPVNSQIILEAGKRHICNYSTEFGNMTLGVFTKNISIDLTPNGGSVKSDYTIDINSHITSLNTICIKIKEATKKDVQDTSTIKDSTNP